MLLPPAHLRTCLPPARQWPLPTSMSLPMLASEAPTLTAIACVEGACSEVAGPLPRAARLCPPLPPQCYELCGAVLAYCRR